MIGASSPHLRRADLRRFRNELQRESTQRFRYLRHNARSLCEYAVLDANQDEQAVCANHQFMAMVPFGRPGRSSRWCCYGRAGRGWRNLPTAGGMRLRPVDARLGPAKKRLG